MNINDDAVVAGEPFRRGRTVVNGFIVAHPYFPTVVDGAGRRCLVSEGIGIAV